MDFRYHDLDPDTGLFERCASLGLVDRVIGETDIMLASQEPPQNTRASVRGRIIRDASERNVSVIVENWESVKIVGKGKDTSMHPFNRQKRMANGLKVNLKDPFESGNSALLSKVRRFMDDCDAV